MSPDELMATINELDKFCKIEVVYFDDHLFCKKRGLSMNGFAAPPISLNNLFMDTNLELIIIKPLQNLFLTSMTTEKVQYIMKGSEEDEKLVDGLYRLLSSP